MHIPRPTNAEAHAGLRALVGVHSTDGNLSPIALRLLAATQQHILHTSFDVESLPPISPEQLAAALVRSEVREAFSGALIIHGFASGDPSPAQLALVEAYCQALGKAPTELTALRHYTQRRLALLRFDVLRHMYIGDALGRIWEDEGVMGFLKMVGLFKGKRSDPALAARYQALGNLPPGTLGHTYFTSIREQGFSLPGEPFAGPEVMARHDMIHVLSGYGTTPDEELLVSAFTGGFRREGAVSAMLFALCLFDLGVQTAPVAQPTIGRLDPDAFFAALVRGSRVTVDFYGDWDLFAVAHLPIETVRAQYNIAPREG